jgi:DNA-binding SARP family transcriptional activator/tetratricopeptide (TPR) repeat protein
VSADQIRYSVLGSVRAWRGGEELDLGSPRQRAVLAVLLLSANRVVPQSGITDGVWGEDAPASSVNLVHTYVARLRRVLEPGRARRGAGRVLARSGSGYVLHVGAGSLDLDEFATFAGRARARRRAADLAGAVSEYTAALALSHGPPLAGIPGPLADTERTRLDELRLAVALERAEVTVELGGHEEVAGELSALAAGHPLRERIVALLMTALYRSGRQAEALEVYMRTRALLADELGIDPGPELQQLQQRILAGDTPEAGAGTAAPEAGVMVPRQLPAGAAHFVGRTAQLRQLTALLEGATSDPGGTVVISVINGLAGVGKTALAVHWSHQIADRFPGGQLYVNLRGYDPFGTPMHPGEALRGFLQAFGLAPDRIPPALDDRAALYRSMLAGRRVLVVLDNARDTAQVRPLVPASPGSLVVVTSRNRLASLVVGEGARPLSLDVLSSEHAAALLIRRIGSRAAAEPQPVAELTGLCARLPLALAIVAARAANNPQFPLAAVAAELLEASARLDALDAGEPHANLRAVLSWSTDALDSQASGVLGLLGVAPGPDISLPAAVSLAGQPLAQTRARLRELEDANLITQHVPGRYRMHDLVRLYAAEYAQHTQPQASRDAALRRLTDFYLRTAHTGDRLLAPYRPEPPRPGELDSGCHPQPLTSIAEAQAWFTSEYPCLVAAQQLAAGRGWHTAVWQLAWALTTFHRRQGRLHDQVATWRAGLAAAARSADPAALALAHTCLGAACATAGHHREALHHLRRALTCADGAGDIAGQALAHSVLTEVWEYQGNDQQALDHATRALHLYQTLGDPLQEARLLGDVGWYHARLGNYGQALAHCRAALPLHRQHDDREAVAATLDSLGYIAHHDGDHEQALDYYHQALTMFRDLRDSYREAEILDCLAQAHAALGQHSAARDAWKHACELHRTQQRPDDAQRIQQQLDALDDSG